MPPVFIYEGNELFKETPLVTTLIEQHIVVYNLHQVLGATISIRS